MSVQFGHWNFDGRPVPADYPGTIRRHLSCYSPDGQSEHAGTGLYLLYGAFHTTAESRRQQQPVLLSSGAILMWDGRLDNRDELSRELEAVVPPSPTDAQLVAAAYERWAEESLPKLIGDWALSLCIPSERIVLLAKDFVGTRPLYYTLARNQITWCTILDPLLSHSREHWKIEEEFAAGWLSFFPATHLTPYHGIYSVPPAAFVRVRDPDRAAVQNYWDFDPTKHIRHNNDSEYEEHFRHIFSEAVRHRLRSATPVLAELSGGIDSSSIVCTAHALICQAQADAPRLDTVSFYDDSEPNWNERPYFTRIEEKLGHPGLHISAEHRGLDLTYDSADFAISPASHRATTAQKQLIRYVETHGNRVLLSGVGGDEMLGGVPTPIPELADLLVQGRFAALMRRSVDWALVTRTPMLHIIAQVLAAFSPTWVAHAGILKKPSEWITPRFAKRHRAAFEGYDTRLKLRASLPSFQENISALGLLKRQLGCSTLSTLPLYEKRYPYLDRDLLEFIFSIPRDQVLRPNERRSLQRRALAGIVPNEVLRRKRKGFITRGPMAAISKDWDALSLMCNQMLSESLGIVDSRLFLAVLERGRRGQEIPIIPVVRTLALEVWLRQFKECPFLPCASRNGSEPSVRSHLGAAL